MISLCQAKAIQAFKMIISYLILMLLSFKSFNASSVHHAQAYVPYATSATALEDSPTKAAAVPISINQMRIREQTYKQELNPTKLDPDVKHMFQFLVFKKIRQLLHKKTKIDKWMNCHASKNRTQFYLWRSVLFFSLD